MNNDDSQNDHDGEMAADRAILIVRAMQWLQANVHVDLNRDDVDDFETLIEIGLDALGDELETVRQALSVCRQSTEGGAK
jgi:hypothetical protein